MSRHIAFFGSSLVSAYWNGAATYYRGILKALARIGYRITFYEPDAYDRQKHRDIPDPDWARVVVYEGTELALQRCLEEAKRADIVVKASGVGVLDESLEREVLELRSENRRVLFWDVDAPATLDRLDRNQNDPFRTLVPRYDWIFTYGGGPPVVRSYQAFGARDCIPIYNALDPETHHRVSPDERFTADLAFLGNRLPDREKRVEEFFLRPAAEYPQRSFLLGGSGWQDKKLPRSVRYVDHVYTRDHNAFNCTPLAVLNISRESMARFGFSPATRVFEAAGAAACIITDAWSGLDTFFEPGLELLVARDGTEVLQQLESLDGSRSRAIGLAGQRRALSEHTYAHRARQVDAILSASWSA